MKTISKTTNQLPGLIALYAIPSWNISSIDGAAITLVSTNDVYNFQFSNDSLQHECKPVESDAGTYYEHKVTGQIFGRSQENTDELQAIKNTKFIVLLMDENLQWKRLGSVENPLTLVYEYTSAKPGYNITFSYTDTCEYYPAAQL